MVTLRGGEDCGACFHLTTYLLHRNTHPGDRFTRDHLHPPDGWTMVHTVIDRISKAAHILALPKVPSAWVDQVFRLHGIPSDTVYDINLPGLGRVLQGPQSVYLWCTILQPMANQSGPTRGLLSVALHEPTLGPGVPSCVRLSRPATTSSLPLWFVNFSLFSRLSAPLVSCTGR